MEVSEAFALISHAIDSKGSACGYLVCGGLRTNAAELVDKLLGKLFADAPEQVAKKCHPDVIYLEPEGKSRTIHVDSMRSRLVEPMGMSAFSGGWKVGIVVGADRMETAAANAFLKALEEPSAKTLYLLLTDAPDSVLATIVSRCQRIDLKLPAGILEGERYEEMARIMKNADNGICEKLQAGMSLAKMLGELKADKDTADEDIPLVRKSFYRTIMHIARKWIVDGSVPRHLAFRNIDAIEDAARQSDNYLGDESVLTYMTDRMTFPAKQGGAA